MKSTTDITSQDYIEFTPGFNDSIQFQWPEVAFSSKNVKKNEFYDKTAKLLERSVTPFVKQALTKNVPNRAKDDPNIANIKTLYRSSEKISNFIRAVHKDLSGDTTLSQKDFAKLSELLVASIREGIVNSMITQLLSPTKVDEVLFADEIFDSCREKLNEGIKKLLEAKRAKSQLVSSVSRVEYNSSHRLRRLDSLAELLELDSSISVCSAVTIVGEQMIVSANNSGELSNYEVADLTRQKLLIIRDFLLSKQSVTIVPSSTFADADRKASVAFVSSSSDIGNSESEEHLDKVSKSGSYYESESDFQAYYRTNLDILASEEELHDVVSRLNSVSRSSHDNNDAAQNLRKLLKSFYLDIGPFSDEEKQIILFSDVLTLLPYAAESMPNSVCLQIERYVIHREYIHSSSSSSSISIDGFPADVRQKNFHCEQLILYFLQHVLEVQKAEIGISKGCCVTCDTLFQRHPQFVVRGTSGQVFPNTVDIFNLTKFHYNGSPIVYRKNGCRHHPSPQDTPGVLGAQGYVERENSYTSEDLVAVRRDCDALNFDASPQKRKASADEVKNDAQDNDVSMAHIIANFHGIHKAKKPRISNLQGIKEASDINSDVDTDDIEIQGPPLYQA